MQPTSEQKKYLPLFRKDLKLYRGPQDPDGSPTYNLLDPMRGQFYKINWKESLIFKYLKPDMTSQRLADVINEASTLKVEPQDVERFFIQCAELDLLRISRGSDHYQARYDKKQMSWGTWFLHHYLYFRIPLLNPDQFLAKTLHYVRPLAHPILLSLYTVLTLWGLYLILGRFDEFLHTFTYFFNLQGLIIYACAISVVKLIHEFSHAYVAKRYDLHVPTMGVAFIVLWPVLYTDVTDGWKLSKRSQRLAISFAGVAAELIIAGISTLGWAVSAPGMMQSIFYVLATTGWISTLLINLNPAVRFDGYYMLCDIWGIDNLQFRAFNVLRWRYLNVLFGVETPPPEEGLKPSRLNAMAIYAIYTYIYRIFLYTAIALFVYYEFTKAVGIVLFVAEVLIFMVWPVVYESRQIYMVRSYFHWNLRSVITSVIAAIATVWFVFPWPHEITFSAVISPVEEQILYVPYDSRVEKLYVQRDQQVKPGDPIIDLQSKMLLRDLGESLLEKNLAEAELKNLSIESTDAKFIAEKQAELAKANNQYEAMLRKQQLLKMKSLLEGVVYTWDNELRVGQSVAEGLLLGKIADPNEFYAVAFVHENQIGTFTVGQEAKVTIFNPLSYFAGQVVRIVPARSETLSYAALASIFQGPLPVTSDPAQKNLLLLVESYYIVYVKLEPPQQIENLLFGDRADVRMRGPWISNAVELFRYIRRILLRESSL